MTRLSTVAALITGGLIANALIEPEVRTVTVTEEVEVAVPGPTVIRSAPPAELPESCQAMIEDYLEQVDHLRDYSEAMADQPMALRRAAIAAHQQDIDLINAALTEQSNIQGQATGPLREVIQGQLELDGLQEQCEKESP